MNNVKSEAKNILRGTVNKLVFYYMGILGGVMCTRFHSAKTNLVIAFIIFIIFWVKWL